ncbi:MAG: LOG family protein [Deltaproteobacteria bacterium]|nr:LOG family protein [Deltaproteobacteria bacterium]
MTDPTAPPRPETVSLADEEGVRRILVDTVFGLWATINNLTRLRPSKRERFRVTIFGSARTEPSHWVYREVKHVAAELAALGCDIVTGGGPGLMQAANEGAAEAAGTAAAGAGSIGIRVQLPFEQQVNPFVAESFEHETFFTRLHHFVLVSDAFVVMPGGIGTVLEAMMIWQLLQVRHLHDVPLVLVGPMWRDLVAWARQYMLRPGFELASPPDMEIPACADGAVEAVALIRARHAAWSAARTAQP